MCIRRTQGMGFEPMGACVFQQHAHSDINSSLKVVLLGVIDAVRFSHSRNPSDYQVRVSDRDQYISTTETFPANYLYR